MFMMADVELYGRRALIVENEAPAAAQMSADLRRSGGLEMATLDSVEAALRFVRHAPVPDVILLDVRHADALGQPLGPIFAIHGVAVVFVSGFDDWFVEDEEIEHFPSAYAHG